MLSLANKPFILSVLMLSKVLVNVFIMSATTLNDLTVSIVMLNVFDAECFCAEYSYAECSGVPTTTFLPG